MSAKKTTRRKQPTVDEAMEMAAPLLADSLQPVAPPDGLKHRILQTIAKEAAAAATLGAVRAAEGGWRETQFPGITYKKLYFDKPSGLRTTLVRMAPGARYPAHRHAGTEQCLILEGDMTSGGHQYGPGDFTWAQAGTIDSALETRTGNLLLIIGSPGDELLVSE